MRRNVESLKSTVKMQAKNFLASSFLVKDYELQCCKAIAIRL
jgi:hypothetical protein